MNARRLFCAAVATLTIASGCSSDDSDQATERDDGAEEFAGEISLDGMVTDGCDPIADDCMYPFPNDYFTVEDQSTATGRRIDFAEESLPANSDGVHIDPTEWNRNDGFSPGAAVLMMLPDVDLEASGVAPLTDIGRSLDEDHPVRILDADTGDIIPHWVELDSLAGDEDPTVYLRPAISLPEGHRIVVGVGPLTDATGSPIVPTDTFRAYRDRLESDVDAVETRRESMEAVFSDLADTGMARDDLLLAWDFTVASAENNAGRLLSMRDQAFEALGDAAPSFTVSDVTPSDSDGIATRVVGTYEIPMFLTGAGEPGSSMTYDDAGAPSISGTYTAPFECIVPDSAGADTPARSSVYGHGLLGTGAQVGSTGPRLVAAANNTIFCGTDLIGMAEEDTPNAAVIVGDLSTFHTLADRLQQGHLNTLFLGRLMKHPDGLRTDAAFQQDGRSLMGDELYYYGISQGGIMGAATTAVAQDWERAVLGVPAMNYGLLLDRSVDFDPFRAIMEPSYPSAADRALGLQLIQMLWDRGEGNGYAQHLTTDPYEDTPTHTVLLQVALGDHQVSTFAADIEARTIGAQVHRPVVADGRTADVDPYFGIEEISEYPHRGSAMIVFDSGAAMPPLTNTPPREGEDPHSDPRADPDAVRQISEFLRPDGVVIDVCDGQPCTADPT